MPTSRAVVDGAGLATLVGLSLVVELRIGPGVAPETARRSGPEESSVGLERRAIDRVAAAVGGSVRFDGPGPELAPVIIRLERAADPAE